MCSLDIIFTHGGNGLSQHLSVFIAGLVSIEEIANNNLDFIALSSLSTLLFKARLYSVDTFPNLFLHGNLKWKIDLGPFFLAELQGGLASS